MTGGTTIGGRSGSLITFNPPTAEAETIRSQHSPMCVSMYEIAPILCGTTGESQRLWVAIRPVPATGGAPYL